MPSIAPQGQRCRLLSLAGIVALRHRGAEEGVYLLYSINSIIARSGLVIRGSQVLLDMYGTGVMWPTVRPTKSYVYIYFTFGAALTRTSKAVVVVFVFLHLARTRSHMTYREGDEMTDSAHQVSLGLSLHDRL